MALFEEVNSVNTYLWIERWQDEDALLDYLQGSTYRMMIGAVNVLGICVEIRCVVLRRSRSMTDSNMKKAGIGLALSLKAVTMGCGPCRVAGRRYTVCAEESDQFADQPAVQIHL